MNNTPSAALDDPDHTQAHQCYDQIFYHHLDALCDAFEDQCDNSSPASILEDMGFSQEALDDPDLAPLLPIYIGLKGLSNAVAGAQQQTASIFASHFQQIAGELSGSRLAGSSRSSYSTDPQPFEESAEGSSEWSLEGFQSRFSELEHTSKASMQELFALQKQPVLNISFSKTAECVLNELYERVDASVLTSVLATPGTVESLQGHTQRQQLQIFNDGSVLALHDAPQSTQHDHLLIALYWALTHTDQLDLHGVQTTSLNHFDDLVDELFEDECLDAVLTSDLDELTQKESLFLAYRMLHQPSAQPFSSLKAWRDSLKSEQTPDGAWRDGFFITLNGSPCDQPEDLDLALGLSVPLSLTAAKRRLRSPLEQVEAAWPSTTFSKFRM